jgi:hypothetical protein
LSNGTVDTICAHEHVPRECGAISTADKYSMIALRGRENPLSKQDLILGDPAQEDVIESRAGHGKRWVPITLFQKRSIQFPTQAFSMALSFDL